MDFENKKMKWMDSVVATKTHNFWQSPLLYFWDLDNDDDGEDNIESFATTKILDAKYEKVDINDAVNAQNHLDKIQNKKLLRVLEKYDTLFDVTEMNLGKKAIILLFF